MTPVRTLTRLELEDIRTAVEQGLAAIPDLVVALSSKADRSCALDDLAAVITGLQVVHHELRLGEIDDDAVEPVGAKVVRFPEEMDDA